MRIVLNLEIINLRVGCLRALDIRRYVKGIALAGRLRSFLRWRICDFYIKVGDALNIFML